MKTLVVVAPHADDETLGCGGTILKYANAGYDVHWILVTSMTEEFGFGKEQVEHRKKEIAEISVLYGFAGVHELNFQPAALDALPKGEVIGAIAGVISKVKPNQVFTPYRNDAHSDHEVVFDAVMSATKSFRYPFVTKVMAYETISETDFGMKPEDGGFRPNVFVDVSAFIESKLTAMEIYKSEMGEFPFPRSRKAIEALATLRGSQSNNESAEAFMLIKELL